MKWSNVLRIVNGKNQRAVESADGKYPIYGSGGIMGYATDYLCPEDTVIIGRKGTINKPLFAKTKFWNVDTAFGLVADKSILFPKYLFYYCLCFDFESLNTTVTIPSLTKAHLLEIEMPVPSLSIQNRIASTLDTVSEVLRLRKAQLAELDSLVKAKFAEMFGDPVSNSKRLPTKMGYEFFKLTNGKFIPQSKRFDTGIPAFGGNGISWHTDEILFNGDTIVVGRVGFQSGNVHLVNGPLWITDNAMYISDYRSDVYNLVFLCALMEHIDFTRFQDAGDLKKITQKPFMSMKFIHPPLSMQHEFVAFVAQVDKSKVAVQKALDETQRLFDSLMSEYFE